MFIELIVELDARVLQHFTLIGLVGPLYNDIT